MSDDTKNSEGGETSSPRIPFSFLVSHPAHFLALGFGSGLSPRAPGTVGTLVAIPCWFLIAPLPLIAQLAVIGLAFLLGVWFCQVASRNLGVHDHGGIVWDEFVGLWLTLVFVPSNQFNLLMGFAFFRIFDIVKPWPIKWFDQRVHGGFGIMLDDVIAGLFAGCALYFLNAWVFV